jgi:hypothetical protein
MSPPDSVYCTVKIEGEDVSDLVTRLQLEESDSLADQARITFGDGDLVLSDVLHEGLAVEIDLGRPDEHAVVFRGVVTGVSANFPARGQPTVELTAADSLILLSMKAQTKRWWNTSVSGIVGQIASANGLLAGTISPGDDELVQDAHPLQQVAETDLAFLNRLAHDYDAKLYVDHSGPTDSLNFVSTQSLVQAAPIEQKLVFNGSLAEFRAMFDAFATAGEEALVSTDPQTGDPVKLSETLLGPTDSTWTPDPARIARLGGGGRIATILAKSAAKKAKLTDYWRVPPREAGAPSRPSSDKSRTLGDRTRRLGQTGRGRALGSIWLKPRVRVTIEGYGGRWSGPWYVSRARHQLELPARTYVTSFLCVR